MDGCVRLLNRWSPTANWLLARIEPDAVYADHRYSHRPPWPAGRGSAKTGGRDTSTEHGALYAQYSLTLPSMSR
jgi:hypothetical protein